MTVLVAAVLILLRLCWTVRATVCFRQSACWIIKRLLTSTPLTTFLRLTQAASDDSLIRISCSCPCQWGWESKQDLKEYVRLFHSSYNHFCHFPCVTDPTPRMSLRSESLTFVWLVMRQQRPTEWSMQKLWKKKKNIDQKPKSFYFGYDCSCTTKLGLINIIYNKCTGARTLLFIVIITINKYATQIHIFQIVL